MRVLFLALGGYTAALFTFAIHEALGHGAVALLVGGRFFDFYLSPLAGSANTLASDPLDVIVAAGGTVVTLATGVLAYVYFRRRLRLGLAILPTVLLWIFACEALLDSLAYMTLEPLLGAMTGLETGDWLHLSARLGFSPWLLALLGVVAIVPITAHLMAPASELVARLGWGTSVPRLRAFWTLLLPGAALLLIYLAVFSPWLAQPLPLALGSVLGVPLLGVLGLAWPMPETRPGSRLGGSVDVRSASRWCALMALVGVLVAAAFGPTMELRRGLALGPADPDQYMSAAQEIRLEIDLGSTAGPRALFISSPRLNSGSPFLRRLTGVLARLGPSVEGATALSEFVATWNLDGSAVLDVTEPIGGTGVWSWEVSLGPWPDSAMIRLWPLTWHRESWIKSVEFAGRDLITSLDPQSDRRGVVRWTRPESMVTVDSFYVSVPRALGS